MRVLLSSLPLLLFACSDAQRAPTAAPPLGPVGSAPPHESTPTGDPGHRDPGDPGAQLFVPPKDRAESPCDDADRCTLGDREVQGVCVGVPTNLELVVGAPSGPEPAVAALTLAPTAEGGMVLGGWTMGESGFRSPWLARLDPAGRLVAEAVYPGDARADGQISAIEAALGEDGSSAGWWLAGTRSVRDRSHDLWVAGLDAAGQVRWQDTFGSPGRDHFAGFEQTPSGDLVVAGHVAGPAPTFAESLVVRRYRADGELMWTLRAEGAQASVRLAALAATDEGGAALATETHGVRELWRVDADGRVLWREVYHWDDGIALLGGPRATFWLVRAVSEPAALTELVSVAPSGQITQYWSQDSWLDGSPMLTPVALAHGGGGFHAAFVADEALHSVRFDPSGLVRSHAVRALDNERYDWSHLHEVEVLDEDGRILGLVGQATAQGASVEVSALRRFRTDDTCGGVPACDGQLTACPSKVACQVGVCTVSAMCTTLDARDGNSCGDTLECVAGACARCRESCRDDSFPD